MFAHSVTNVFRWFLIKTRTTVTIIQKSDWDSLQTGGVSSIATKFFLTVCGFLSDEWNCFHGCRIIYSLLSFLTLSLLIYSQMIWTNRGLIMFGIARGRPEKSSKTNCGNHHECIYNNKDAVYKIKKLLFNKLPCLLCNRLESRSEGS